MSSRNNNKRNNGNNRSGVMEFNITENMENFGIKEFTLEGSDFLIKWSDGTNSSIDFTLKPFSISKNIKLINASLKKQVKSKNISHETLEHTIKDIEDQLIKKRVMEISRKYPV